jgi:tetratricopeptide (TPR) repeat protein
MNDSSKAVFLSYASQDAEAAGRIHDVLRDAGVEVWFDRSELRGGDAWDASIRRQIRECALFLAIVSANTQRRTEGYFRLEWRLAEQRSHLMARGRPFLVPVVIDETREAGAHVPDGFLDVQWTRLPGGQCDAAFAARIQQLLSGATPSRVAAPASAEARSPAAAPRSPGFPGRRAGIIAIAVLAVAAAALFWRQERAGEAPPDASAADSTSVVAAERVAKARALLDDDPLRTRRNVELAEQFALEAIEADSSSAEAFAAAALANYRFIVANYEDTPRRRADLRSYAEKAKLLDPGSVDAELAVCSLLHANRDWAEAGRCLADLMQRVPGNLPVLRQAVSTSIQSITDGDTSTPIDEHTSDLLDRLAAASPFGRAEAETSRASLHWQRGEYVEADRLLDTAFESGLPVRGSYLIRLLVLQYGWGDLDSARSFAATIPTKLLLEDVFITRVATLWIWVGEYEKALETLSRSQRDMLQEALVQLPTDALRGDAHAAAGRQAAAELHWRDAIKTLDRLLGEEPDRAGLRELKAVLLARLGEREAAAAEHALARELKGSPTAGSIAWAREFDYYLAAGDREGAIVRLDRLVQRDHGRWPNSFNLLRHDPLARSLHDDPRVQTMLERGARWLAEKKAGSSGPPAPH